LSYNNFTHIGPRAFSYLPKLRDLTLTLNKIRTIHDDAFGGLNKLNRLSLNHNELTTVPNLKGLDVGTLSLAANRIQLNRHSFENVSILSLQVDGNKITDLSPVTRLSDSLLTLLAGSNPLGNSSAADLYHLIESLPTLRDLYLVSSGLSTIPDFRILKENFDNFNLRVKDNPFECDARLAWLRNTSLAITDYESIVCASPPEHKGRLLHTIPLQDLCPGEL
ncbi:hypothetical protein CAPTEDRAFT_143203, partial [Capitella teleta]